jgi:3-oxoadipate enol-lactonase
MPFAEINKLKLYYETHGTGPRLLFIPGTASDLRQYPNIFQSPLSKYFELLCFDPRGIGQSNSPDAQPTMLSYATDVKDILDFLGWKTCHCVGESFGGMIAQEFAVSYPQYVEKLVLVVTSSGGKGGSSFPYHEYDISKMTLEQRADFWVQCGDKRAELSDWKNAHHDLYQQQYQFYLNIFQRGIENPECSAFSARQIHARKFHDTFDRLAHITMPTYICGGRYDKTAPLENQFALLQQIPCSRLTIFDGSHMLLWQDPFSFQSIKDFLLLERD